VTDLDPEQQLSYIFKLPQLIARARIIVNLANALTSDSSGAALSEFVVKTHSNNKLKIRDNADSITVQFASTVVDRQLRPRRKLNHSDCSKPQKKLFFFIL
jgi:hypothetical protein